jgi:hypothetical protein
MNDERQQFDALSFLYACGKATPEEAAWMEDMMARHPAWREAFEQERLLVRQARIADAELRLAAAPLVSFEDIAAAAAAEEAAARPAPARAKGAAEAGLPQRLLAWWRRPVRGGMAYGAMAMLALLVSVQTWRLEQGGPGEDDGKEGLRYRGGADLWVAPEAQLKVVFDDRISAGQLRAELARLGLNIVHGPDPQGAYLLSVGDGDAEQAARRLQASGLALDVLPLPRR